MKNRYYTAGLLFSVAVLPLMLALAGSNSWAQECPWHAERWAVVERGPSYSVYKCPHGECNACRAANTPWGPGHHVVIHGFGYRSSFRAGGNVAGEWRRYETYKYLLTPDGRRYGERRVE